MSDLEAACSVGEEAGEKYVPTEAEVTVFSSSPFPLRLQREAAMTNLCHLVLHAQRAACFH